MSSIENVAAMFCTALEMEQKGREFYRDAANLVNDDKIASVLFGLMHDEEAHERMISQYYNALKHGHGWPDPSTEFQASEEDNRRIFNIMAETIGMVEPDSSVLEVYQTALRMERESLEFYQEHLDKVTDKELKVFLEFLVRAVAVHIDVIESILVSAVETYEEAEDIESVTK